MGSLFTPYDLLFSGCTYTYLANVVRPVLIWWCSCKVFAKSTCIIDASLKKKSTRLMPRYINSMTR